MAPRVASAAVRALRRAAHTFAFPPPAVTALPVDGATELFPVRRVFCVGRNYAAVRRGRQARRRCEAATARLRDFAWLHLRCCELTRRNARSTRARWAATRTASRRFFSASPRTRWWQRRPQAACCCASPLLRPTCTTRWSRRVAYPYCCVALSALTRVAGGGAGPRRGQH